MVDWAEEFRRKLEESAEDIEDTVKGAVSRASEEVTRSEEKVRKLAQEREDIRRRLTEKITIIKEGMEKGKALYDKKEYFKAEEHFNSVIAVDPHNEEAQKFLKKIYKKIGKPENERERREIPAADISDVLQKIGEEKAPEEETPPESRPEETDESLAKAFQELKEEKASLKHKEEEKKETAESLEETQEIDVEEGFIQSEDTKEVDLSMILKGEEEETKDLGSAEMDDDLVSALQQLKKEKEDEEAKLPEEASAVEKEIGPAETASEEKASEERGSEKAEEEVPQEAAASREEEDSDLVSAFSQLKDEVKSRDEEKEPAQEIGSVDELRAVEEIEREAVSEEKAEKLKEEDGDLVSALQQLKKEKEDEEAKLPEEASAVEKEIGPAEAASEEEASEERGSEKAEEEAPQEAAASMEDEDRDLVSALQELKEEQEARPEGLEAAEKEEKEVGEVTEEKIEASERAEVPSEEKDEEEKKEPKEEKKEPEEAEEPEVSEEAKEKASEEAPAAVIEEKAKAEEEAPEETAEAAETEAEEDLSEEEFQKFLEDSGVKGVPEGVSEEVPPQGEISAPVSEEKVKEEKVSEEKAEEEKEEPKEEKKEPEEAAKPEVSEEAKEKASEEAPAAAVEKGAAEDVSVEEVSEEEALKEEKEAAPVMPSVEIAEEKPKKKMFSLRDAREMMGSFKKLLPYAAVIFIGMIVASTLTLVLVIKSTDPSRQADKILRSGARMINEGNLSQGIETLSVLSGYFADNSQLLDKFIHAADVIYEAELVTSEGKMEKYKEAKRIYEQIIKNFPTNDQVLNKGVYFKAADCAKELGLLDDAIKLYDGVITKFQPSLMVARALFEKANTLVEQGKYDQARKIYADIIRDYPDSEFAGRSYFKLAQSYRAEADKIKKEYNIQ